MSYIQATKTYKIDWTAVFNMEDYVFYYARCCEANGETEMAARYHAFGVWLYTHNHKAETLGLF